MNFNVIPILVSNEKVIAKQFRLLDTLSTDVLFVAQRDSRHNLRCSFRPPPGRQDLFQKKNAVGDLHLSGNPLSRRSDESTLPARMRFRAVVEPRPNKAAGVNVVDEEATRSL